jgi:hypothetical protein
VPLVLTAKILSRSSGGSDSTDALKATPAFEINASTSPASANAASIEAWSVTSSRNFPATSSPSRSSSLRAVAMTRCPRRESSAAVARPMPCEAPVIRTDDIRVLQSVDDVAL